MTAAVRLPFVTAGLPGSGGTLKETPEDFRVYEIPAYPPSGEGPHLWLQVEMRGRTTRDVVREAARLLGVQERDVGVAGLKDRGIAFLGERVGLFDLSLRGLIHRFTFLFRP